MLKDFWVHGLTSRLTMIFATEVQNTEQNLFYPQNSQITQKKNRYSFFYFSFVWLLNFNSLFKKKLSTAFLPVTTNKKPQTV